MKATIKVEKEFDIKYLAIDAKVRYWEDTDINGEQDVDLYECTDKDISPRMPFAEKDIRDEWRWRPIIDVDECKIIDWPIGTTANIHYKVCDDGIYSILDKDMNEIFKA